MNESIVLLLTDIIMPDTNGPELAEKAKKLFPLINLLFMLGYTEEAIVNIDMLESGVNYIQKPISLNALNRELRIYLMAKIFR